MVRESLIGAGLERGDIRAGRRGVERGDGREDGVGVKTAPSIVLVYVRDHVCACG